jgi:anti-anti-sigma regulatory factor
MDAHARTIKTVRDGPVCTLILSGDLDLLETGGFLEQAAPAVDGRAGRLGSGLAEVLFLDCAGVLRITTRLAAGGCPVVVCPLSPMARRIVELLGLDQANLPKLSLGDGLRDGPRDSRTGPRDLVPAERGAPFLAGTEGCP